jgi:hypothetical protein
MAKLHDLDGSNGLELIEATPTQDLQYTRLYTMYKEMIGKNWMFCIREQVWRLHFYVLKNVSTFYVHNFNPLHLTTKKLYIREVKLQDIFNLKIKF